MTIRVWKKEEPDSVHEYPNFAFSYAAREQAEIDYTHDPFNEAKYVVEKDGVQREFLVRVRLEPYFDVEEQ